MRDRPWPETVADAIRNSAKTRGAKSGFTFCDPREADKEYTWEALLDAARARAAALYAHGLRKGDRVALVVPGSEDFVLNFMGAVLGGMVPVPMYPPVALGKVDSYVKNVEHIVTSSGARALLVSKAVRPILGSALDTGAVEKLLIVEELNLNAPREGSEPAISPDDLCFLQYTSGSTSAPKGVRVTHGNLAHNAWGIMREGLAADCDTDRGLSWLPLYHDMGLIGFVIAPLFDMVPITFLPTMEFVKRPVYWLDMLHKHKATLTFAPNFAFALTARKAKESDMGNWDLSHLRMMGCGAEPIQPDTLRRFSAHFAKTGLNPSVMTPCYGMAEITLAISFARTGADGILKVDAVSPDSLRDGEAKPLTTGGATDEKPVEVVSCGTIMPGHEVSILDEEGNALPDRMIGEIVIKGPSVSTGYFNNPEATEKSFRADGLHSGDLGYMADGHLYVCGRVKDMIIIHGRNYYPTDIEWVAQEVPGVRKGSVIAFASQPENTPTEQLIIVAEWSGKDKPSDTETLRIEKEIVSRVQAEIGLSAQKVVLIPAGTIPKTSSGKLQRRKAKDQFERGTLGVEGPGTESLQAKAAVAKQVVRSYATMATHGLMSRLPEPMRAALSRKK